MHEQQDFSYDFVAKIDRSWLRLAEDAGIILIARGLNAMHERAMFAVELHSHSCKRASIFVTL